jgi:hypothetical protein
MEVEFCDIKPFNYSTCGTHHFRLGKQIHRPADRNRVSVANRPNNIDTVGYLHKVSAALSTIAGTSPHRLTLLPLLANFTLLFDMFTAAFATLALSSLALATQSSSPVSPSEIQGTLCSIKTYGTSGNWPWDQQAIVTATLSARVDGYVAQAPSP